MQKWWAEVPVTPDFLKGAADAYSAIVSQALPRDADPASVAGVRFRIPSHPERGIGDAVMIIVTGYASVRD